MVYHKVFDVAEQGIRVFWFPAAGALFVLVGVIFFVFRRYLRPRFLRFIPIVLSGFGLLLTLASIPLTLLPHIRLVSALSTGRCSVTEGKVQNFQPMPPSGHGEERFTVNGKTFAYSDFIVSPGFHKTQFCGGPMREGLQVRIQYLGGDIARLEIAVPESEKR